MPAVLLKLAAFLTLVTTLTVASHGPGGRHGHPSSKRMLTVPLHHRRHADSTPLADFIASLFKPVNLERLELFQHLAVERYGTPAAKLKLRAKKRALLDGIVDGVAGVVDGVVDGVDGLVDSVADGLGGEATRPDTGNAAVNASATQPGTSAAPTETTTSSTPGATGSSSIPLLDRESQDEDIMFYGDMSIGGQSFEVIFDTGSSDLWVVSEDCETNCPSNVAEYSPSPNYQDLNRSFSIQYGIGAVSGHLGTDTVEVAGFSVENQTFASVNKLSSDWKSQIVSGILGLAFPAISNSRATPWFQNLIAQGHLDSPAIGFALGRVSDGDDHLSEMTIGGVNESKYTGDITYFPVESETYWGINFAGIKLANGTSFAMEGGLGAIDTGTTLFMTSLEQAEAFWSTIPEATPLPGYTGYYQFPCLNDINITVEFDGLSVPIAATDMNLGLTNRGSEQCVGGIVGTDIPMSVLGITFLKNVYSVYDTERGVGFATPAY